jgi:type IV secretory pathway protease TraF
LGRAGQALTPFAWGRRPLPAGSAYLGSDHEDGFDSRYYGPVSIARLTRMERVL